jgi:hypothetical protein
LKAKTPPAEGPEAGGEPPKDAGSIVQELAQEWQSGEHMGVAARLMFTQANYRDFVDLLFLLGHDEGRELGVLLDELADSEQMQPPKTPPEYSDLLRRVAGGQDTKATV